MNAIKFISNHTALLVLVLFSFGLMGCDSNDDDDPDIVQVAIDNGFTTLVSAVEAADLVSTLQGDGPFTVFAPTDAAFNNLPAGTLESLLLPENQSTLSSILTYHVIADEVTAEEVVTLTSAPTVQGENITIRVEGGTVFVNDAQVTTTDVEASNGIIHVIDTVLLPPSTQ